MIVSYSSVKMKFQLFLMVALVMLAGSSMPSVDAVDACNQVCKRGRTMFESAAAPMDTVEGTAMVAMHGAASEHFNADCVVRYTQYQ